ncbi:MAG: tetratricopeptide repeat protein [Bacteroidales bacterium]|nr:tetratricopeptide repeat protein [Bacteroidales bacterium]
MLRSIFFTINILLFVTLSFSEEIEENQVDSLLRGKAFMEQEKTLDSLISRYNFSNPSIGLKLSRRYNDLIKSSEKMYYHGKSKYNLGLAYEMMGEFKKALEYLFEAKKIFTGTKYTKNLALVYNEIGMVYLNQPNKKLLEKSLDYFFMFLKFSQKMDDPMEIAGAYSNIGLTYNRMNMLDSALFYHEKSLEIRLELNDKRCIGISYANLGEINQQNGNYNKALSYLQKTQSNYETINYRWGMYEAYIDIANIFLKLNQFDSSKLYSFKALDVSRELNSKFAIQTTCSLLGEYYKAVHDFENAVKYIGLSNLYTDSINSESTRNKMVQMQTIYEVDKKNQEIELLEEKNNSKQRWVVTIIISGFCIILIFVYALIINRSKRKKEILLFKTEKKLSKKNEDLIKSKLEQSELKEQELNNEIKYKSKQLSTHALHMIQKNTILQEIQNEVKDLSKKANANEKPRYKRISHQINQSLRADNDWDVFRLYFEDVNKNFFSYLKSINSDLTTNDLRLCALVKLNMNSKEMASVLNIAPNSIKSARYRLKKKLDLDIEADLEEFIRKIEK